MVQTVEMRDRVARAGGRQPVTLVFDPENVLIDTTPGVESSLRQALRDVSVRLPRDWAICERCLERPLLEVLTTLMGDLYPERIAEAAQRYSLHFNRTGRFEGRLRPGAIALLERLNADAGFHFCYLAHIGVKAAQKLLEVHRIERYVGTIVAPEAPSCAGQRSALFARLIDSRPRRQWMLLSDHAPEMSIAHEMGVPVIDVSRDPLRMDSAPSLAQVERSIHAASLALSGVFALPPDRRLH